MAIRDKVKYGFAEMSEDGKYRYLLKRDFYYNPFQPPAEVVFIMLNPSTADGLTDDATIRRCMAFALEWRATRMTVVNLFAARATKPRALYYFDDPVGPRNNEFIRRACAPKPDAGQWDGQDEGEPLVICGWGNHGLLRGRAWDVQTMLWDAGIPIHYLRKNAHTNQPTHPLYLPATTEPIPWSEQRIYAPGFKNKKETVTCAP